MIKAQEENFCKVLEMRDTFKTALDKVNEENKKLGFKNRELTKNDINKKVLNFAIEENEKLQSALIMERDRAIKFKNDNKNGEEYYNNKINENKNLKHEIGQLKNVIESNNIINTAATEEDEWESCSEASVEITNQKIIRQKYEEKNCQKIESKNSKMYFPSKFSNETKNPKNISVNKEICYFYTQKRCKFGDNCYNAHPKDYFQKNGHFDKNQRRFQTNNPTFQQNGTTQKKTFHKYQQKPYSTFPQNQNKQFNSKIVQNSGTQKTNQSQYSSVLPSYFPKKQPNQTVNLDHNLNFSQSNTQNHNFNPNEKIINPQNFYQSKSINQNFNQTENEFPNQAFYFYNSNSTKTSKSTPRTKEIPVIGTN